MDNVRFSAMWHALRRGLPEGVQMWSLSEENALVIAGPVDGIQTVRARIADVERAARTGAGAGEP